MLAAAHIVLCDRDPETTAARSDADHEPSQLAIRWWNGQLCRVWRTSWMSCSRGEFCRDALGHHDRRHVRQWV